MNKMTATMTMNPSNHQNRIRNWLKPINMRVGNGSSTLNPLKMVMNRGIMKNMKKAMMPAPTQHTMAG